ncbi:hypothetical protein [Methanobrevibacter sp.]|uniref:hypothetical protein n=1 Tax=Methanobrevibacter sp. TaxID=66852 RepID=UPI00386CCC22
MNLEWEKTDGESKLSKSPFITDSSYLRVFNSTIIYKDIENINIKSIFKFNVTVFSSMVSPPCNECGGGNKQIPRTVGQSVFKMKN